MVNGSVETVFFFQAEDGIRDAQESRGLGDVYKRQGADLVVDGRQHPLYDPDDGGFFLGVSLMDKVTPELSLIHI